MKIIQVLPSLAYGDAVGNDVIAIRKILRQAGYKEVIYAENIGRQYQKDRGVLRAPKEWKEPEEDDIIIYHFAIGWPNIHLVENARCKKICIYHNITPYHFFSKYDPVTYENCKAGLSAIKDLKDTFDYCIADSEFNKQDLLSYGFTCPIDVLPIIIPFDDYKTVPNKKILEAYAKDKGSKGHNIIFTGRIAPNKCQQDVIAAFSMYKKYYDPAARLFIVGNHGGSDDSYYMTLQEYCRQLGTEDILFTGHIPFDEILAYYRAADLFLCMSEHEGFCVPIVEAMLFELPIIAFDAGAVRSTTGQGGIVITKKDPLQTAGLIDRIMNDEKLRSQIIAGQKIQLDRFSYDRVKQQFLYYLDKAVKL